MTAAQSILEELHAEIGGAEAHLVRAEGESKAGRVKFRELAIDQLTKAQRDIERVTKLIEAELYQPAAGDGY
jgi:hypothetical protein